MSDGVSLAFALLILILPISALVARRLPVRQWMPMAAAWVVIFILGWLLISYFT